MENSKGIKNNKNSKISIAFCVSISILIYLSFIYGALQNKLHKVETELKEARISIKNTNSKVTDCEGKKAVLYADLIETRGDVVTLTAHVLFGLKQTDNALKLAERCSAREKEIIKLVEGKLVEEKRAYGR